MNNIVKIRNYYYRIINEKFDKNNIVNKLDILINDEIFFYFDGGSFNFMSYDPIDDNSFLMIKEGEFINRIERMNPTEDICFKIFENIDTFYKRNIISKTYLISDGNGLIKIGKSENPKLRISAIKSHNPYAKLIAICENDIESELHYKFEDYRFKGEWFELNEEQIKSLILNYNFQLI